MGRERFLSSRVVQKPWTLGNLDWDFIAEGQCISALKPEVQQVLVQVQRLPPRHGAYTVLSTHEVTRLDHNTSLRALVPEARVFVCPCLVVSTILEIRAAQQRQSHVDGHPWTRARRRCQSGKNENAGNRKQNSSEMGKPVVSRDRKSRKGNGRIWMGAQAAFQSSNAVAVLPA